MRANYKMGVHTPTVGFYKMAAHTFRCVDVKCAIGFATHFVEIFLYKMGLWSCM